MKIGIFGTGVVGKTIGSRLIELGYEVMMGSRTPENENAVAWLNTHQKNASIGTFADVSKFAEIIFNCTKGEISLEVMKLAGLENLANKTIIDLANPLDFSKGFPPSLSICNTNSLGEEIQKLLPNSFVVKTLNTMNCELMARPDKLTGKHDVFICGNDDAAKSKVKELLSKFGWASPIDLGDITNARGTEMLLPIWVRLYGKFQHANFNFHIQM